MYIDEHHYVRSDPQVNTTNSILPKELSTEESQRQCIKDIHAILSKGYSTENNDKLVEYIQRQRALLVDVIVDNFLKKPNPKMADAVNTLLAQMEKSVRDDRKEALKGKELETSKETFELFSRSLQAVVSGQLSIPTFNTTTLPLDPMKPIKGSESFEFKEGEFVTGHPAIDLKPIEEQLEKAQTSSDGAGEL